MTSLLEEARFRGVGLLGSGLVTGLLSTIEVEREGTQHFRRVRRDGGGVLFAFWHDQLLPLVHVHRDEGAVVLVSQHADGEYVARVLQRKGFGTVRGSSTRGGARGLRELLRAAREGRDLAVTPDGPRGPRHRVKEGAIVAAQLSGHAVIPLGVAASSAWRFDSWDRFMVPRPFSRIQVVYGPPRRVSRDAGPAERSRAARELQDSLEELTVRARHEVAGHLTAGAERADEHTPDRNPTRPDAAPGSPGGRDHPRRQGPERPLHHGGGDSGAPTT